MMIVNLLVRDNLVQFLDHFSKLTTEDRYCRFFHTIGLEAIRDWLLRTTEIPYSNYFFVEKDAVGEFTGISQLALDPETLTGEIAISVLPEYRKQAVATRLILETIDAARKMNLKTVHFQCEAGNRGCRRLYSNLGFSAVYDPQLECIVGSLSLGDAHD